MANKWAGPIHFFSRSLSPASLRLWKHFRLNTYLFTIHEFVRYSVGHIELNCKQNKIFHQYTHWPRNSIHSIRTSEVIYEQRKKNWLFTSITGFMHVLKPRKRWGERYSTVTWMHLKIIAFCLLENHLFRNRKHSHTMTNLTTRWWLNWRRANTRNETERSNKKKHTKFNTKIDCFTFWACLVDGKNDKFKLNSLRISTQLKWRRKLRLK